MKRPELWAAARAAYDARAERMTLRLFDDLTTSQQQWAVEDFVAGIVAMREITDGMADAMIFYEKRGGKSHVGAFCAMLDYFVLDEDEICSTCAAPLNKSPNGVAHLCGQCIPRSVPTPTLDRFDL